MMLFGLILIAIIAIVLLGWLFVSVARKPELGAFLIVFFLPFERIPSIQLAGVTVRANHLIGAITLLVWLGVVLARKRRLVSHPVFLSLGLLVSTLLLAVTAAHNLTRGISVFIFTIITMVFCFLVIQLINKRSQLKPILWILGATTIIASLFGLYQFAGDLFGLPMTLTGLDPGYIKDVFGFPRIQAFSQEPLYFGNFLLLPIALALAFILIPQKWLSQKILMPFLALALLALGLTLSRGAFVGLFGVAIALLIFLGGRFLSRNALIFLGGGATLGVVAVFLILSVLGPTASERFWSHLTIQDFGRGESTVGRLTTWTQALEFWQSSPWVGIGPGNFGPASLDYPKETPARGWPIVNNEYLELLAETGVLGLGAFLLFITTLLGYSVKAYRRARDDPEARAILVGLTAAVVGMLVQFNFFSTLYITSLWITFGLLLATQAVILNKHHEQ